MWFTEGGRVNLATVRKECGQWAIVVIRTRLGRRCVAIKWLDEHDDLAYLDGPWLIGVSDAPGPAKAIAMDFAQSLGLPYYTGFAEDGTEDRFLCVDDAYDGRGVAHQEAPPATKTTRRRRLKHEEESKMGDWEKIYHIFKEMKNTRSSYVVVVVLDQVGERRVTLVRSDDFSDDSVLRGPWLRGFGTQKAQMEEEAKWQASQLGLRFLGYGEKFEIDTSFKE